MPHGQRHRGYVYIVLFTKPRSKLLRGFSEVALAGLPYPVSLMALNGFRARACPPQPRVTSGVPTLVRIKAARSELQT